MALRSGAPVISTSSVPRLLLPIGPLVATCSSAPRLLLPINALAGNLHIGAPAGNKPHLAEKSTPVWLAIWRTWAGFANSQLRRAAFRCTYSYICIQPRYCRLEPLLRQTQIFRPICTDCLRHLRISAE